MTFGKTARPVLSATPKKMIYAGKFAGINGASPSTYKLDPGVTVARSGEGVWVVTLPRPIGGYKAILCQATDDDGNAHDLAYTSSVANRTVTITHRTATQAVASTHSHVVVVKGRLPDVAAADADTSNRAYSTAPVAGTVSKIQAQIISGGPLNAAAIVTNKINGSNITTGAITLPDTSAVGTVVAVTPTAANTVAVGDILTGVTDAGGSTTAAVDLYYTITIAGAAGLAAEDVIDEISFLIVAEESDAIGAGV